MDPKSRTDDYIKNMIRKMLREEGYVLESLGLNRRVPATPPVITIGPDCQPQVLVDA